MDCLQCGKLLKGPNQKKFCSQSCSTTHYVTKRHKQSKVCPHCSREIYSRWLFHISRCLERQEVKKQNKLSSEAKKEKASQEKRRSCWGCGEVFYRSNGKFCSVECFKDNRALIYGTPEYKEKLSKATSESMKRRYASGWEPVCGRTKKYKHTSPIAGNITVDGTWELLVAVAFDSAGFRWSRNRKRFSYRKAPGKRATYQPDFYIEDFEAYVEVKGYETDLDRKKWSQFPEKLFILRREEISLLKEGKSVEWPSLFAKQCGPFKRV